jgi:hypothetical protein
MFEMSGIELHKLEMRGLSPTYSENPNNISLTHLTEILKSLRVFSGNIDKIKFGKLKGLNNKTAVNCDVKLCSPV